MHIIAAYGQLPWFSFLVLNGDGMFMSMLELDISIPICINVWID